MPEGGLLAGFGLVALGVVIGAYGTLIGAGGGFLLVPALLLLYPHDSPTHVTAVSLAVVLANAAAGSVSYYRIRMADYVSGSWLALATIPGAIVGAMVVGDIPRTTFEVVMGVALLLVGGFLAIRPHGRLPLLQGSTFSVERSVTDAEGKTYRYRFNQGLAMAISAVVGFLSSLLGIGGGIIHVPVLSTFFDFPPHVATATSHFVLVFTAGAGTIEHVLAGDYSGSLVMTAALAVGVICGAPFGAALSRRVTGGWIIRLLAIALVVVGLRLLTAV